MKASRYFWNAKRITEITDLGREELLRLLCAKNDFNFDELRTKSKSQINQDIFVISNLRGIKNGYFVEFGATDGIGLSNTFLLEKEYDWHGILVEPGKNWKQELTKNRKGDLDFRCVSAHTGEFITFSEATSPELSTISGFENHDQNKRITKASYSVETVSLLDLLIQHHAPMIIDYISIDTEGTEFDILKNFDFSKYKFKIMTVEHNFTSERDKIFQLLTANGYHRIWSEFTQFDDWYINPALI